MADTHSRPPARNRVSNVTLALRFVFAGLATLFASGVVVQVFLAGLGVLVNPAYFAWHSPFAHMLEPILLPALILGALGRVGWAAIGLNLLLFATFTLQYVFLYALEGAGRGLHVVNALVLVSAASLVYVADRTATRSPSALAGSTPTATATDDAPAAGAGQRTGATIFAGRCSTCHGDDGRGGIGPRLAGSDALADADHVLDRILYGKGIMPAWGDQLSDAQVAAVASYLRGSWGNDFGSVTPKQVAALR